MARNLLIDWDQGRLTAVLDTGVRGAKCQGFSIATEMVPNPVTAEDLGAFLREQAKARGWQVTGLVALVGRDRLVAREFRVPLVPLNEEPELIRLQTTRELIDAADEVAIDYNAWTDEADPGQRRVLALALRNELLETYRKVAASAGWRLAGLVPRGAGLAALAERESPEVIVGVGADWREIVLARSGHVTLSRFLAGSGWAQEVRRVLASQGMTGAGSARVRLVGGSGADLAALGAVLGETPPVQDPVPVELEPCEGPWGSFAALAGVARSGARKTRLLDFLNPKKSPPPSNEGAKRLALYGSAAGLLLTFLVGMAWWKVSSREDEVALMRRHLEERKAENKRMTEDEKKITALAAWETPVWLEELVDIACRIPDTKKLQVTQIITSQVSPTGSTGANLSEFNSRMEIRGVFPEGTGDPREVDRIDAELRKATATRQYLSKVKKSGNNFTLDVQVRARAADSYTLVPPPKPPAKSEKEDMKVVPDAEGKAAKETTGEGAGKETPAPDMDKETREPGKEAKEAGASPKDKR